MTAKVQLPSFGDTKIPNLPSTYCFHYIPKFITAEEEIQIQTAIYALPSTRWTNLSHRRLLSLPSSLTGTQRDVLLSSPLPQFLVDPILTRFEALGLFKDSPHRQPNHCLVNEYKGGEGIMPHEDGPAYHPVTATVSLGSHTVLDIYTKTHAQDVPGKVDGHEREPRWRILQEARSLLVTTGDVYQDTLHGIADVEADEQLNEAQITNWALLADREAFVSGRKERTLRVSLTYRDVLKVTHAGGALKFLGRR